MADMLYDLVAGNPPSLDDQPTAKTKAFYRTVASADELVHEKTTQSSLSATARLLSVKSMHNMSIAQDDDIVDIILEVILPESKLPRNFYHSRKLLVS